MRTIKAVMLTLLITCLGCKDEANPKFPSIEVAINDTSRVAISDSIYFITADTLPNKVTVVSEVSEPHIFYSVNNAVSKKGISESITLQKQDSIFQFYLAKRGYRDSELKTVVLQAYSEKFLNKVNISSPVFDSDINISMSDKSRGVVEIEIFSITGRRLLHRNHLKTADSFIIKYAVAEYPRGTYLVFATYGKNQKVYKFIKK